MSDNILMFWCRRCGAPMRLKSPGLTLAPGARVTLRSPQWPPCPSCGNESFASCKPFIVSEHDRKMLRTFGIGWPSAGLHG